MKIGYLMNTYPLVSTTFIGREIAALEAEGLEIHRYAARAWTGTLPDAQDQAEAGRTTYLLGQGFIALFGALLDVARRHPRGLMRAVGLWARLLRNAGGGMVRHAAYLLEAALFVQLARRDRIAHVHAHFSTNATAVAMLAEAMGGPGYSFTVHGPDEFFVPYANSLALKASRARFVACISHFCRSQVMALSDPAHWSRYRIVHCGVAPDLYRGESRAASGKDVLFIGRLSQVKGMAVLIDAFARVAPQHPDAQLALVGDGPERAALERQVEALGLAARVRFLGFVSQQRVAEELARSDVLVLPSFAEGLPVVLMEAGAAGMPVITTRIAGIPELVEDGVTGFVVPPGDMLSLAERLDQLLGDPDCRARMGAAARARVEEDFAIGKEAQWLAALLRGAVTGALPESLRPAETSINAP